MPEHGMHVRWIGRVAVVGLGPNAGGEPVPEGVIPREWLAGSRGVVVDFAGVAAVSSVLIGCMIRLHQILTTTGGRFVICCPDKSILDVLTVTHLHRLIPLYDTLTEALASFDRPTT